MRPPFEFQMPGWPPVEHPSVATILLLLVVLPVAVGGLITVIGMAPTWRRGLAGPDERSLELARGEGGVR